MWRLNNIGQLIEPLALRIHEFWNGFPRNKKLGLSSKISGHPGGVFGVRLKANDPRWLKPTTLKVNGPTRVDDLASSFCLFRSSTFGDR